MAGGNKLAIFLFFPSLYKFIFSFFTSFQKIYIFKKPLCRGLTFSRSQQRSCSATEETPTQKQVVYGWFSTKFPRNVRCVMGEGAAAFPAITPPPPHPCPGTKGSPHRSRGTRAMAHQWGRRSQAIRGQPRLPRPTEASAALPYRSAWAGF